MTAMRIIDAHGREAQVECRPVPSKSWKWGCIYVNPGTGQCGGARFFKTKKAADGLRRASRTPAIVGDIWNL